MSWKKIFDHLMIALVFVFTAILAGRLLVRSPEYKAYKLGDKLPETPMCE